MKILLISIVVLGMFFGCSSSKEPGGEVETPVDKDFELASHLINSMMAPRVASLLGGMSELQKSVRQVCGGEIAPQPVEHFQSLWTQVMLDYHYTEVFLYGPLLVEEKDKFGDFNPIKDVIYSLQDPEKQAQIIDLEVNKANTLGDKYRLRSRSNIIGLDSIEYLLFKRMSEGFIMAQGNETCVYFQAVNDNLMEWIGKVSESFFKMVYDPFQTAAGQTQARAYADACTKGLVSFADKVLKDRKLAAPLGIQSSSGHSCNQGVDCHTLYIEHQYANISRLSTLTSLQAIEDSFMGTVSGQLSGLGFASYIENDSAQLKSLANNELVKTWEAMPAGVDYFESFAQYQGDESLENKAYAAYSRVKKLTDWLKTDFIADMNAELPENVQGDTD